MKKANRSKLSLRRETVVNLGDRHLLAAAGGIVTWSQGPWACWSVSSPTGCTTCWTCDRENLVAGEEG